MAITLDEAQALARPDSVKKTGVQGQTARDLNDRFLTLLVTQMRNQDPLNPMENAEVTTQLAQISTVTGVDKLNATIESMSKAFNGAQSLQAASLVGHGVLAPGNVMDLTAAGAVGGIDLSEPATFVDVEIRDAKNLLVKTLNLGDKPAGVFGFDWDGTNEKAEKLANGPYTFTVKAHRDGTSVESATLAHTKVSSVTLGGAEVELNTKTLGTLRMSDVKQIF